MTLAPTAHPAMDTSAGDLYERRMVVLGLTHEFWR
jgi:hypothetical protein